MEKVDESKELQRQLFDLMDANKEDFMNSSSIEIYNEVIVSKLSQLAEHEQDSRRRSRIKKIIKALKRAKGQDLFPEVYLQAAIDAIRG